MSDSYDAAIATNSAVLALSTTARTVRLTLSKLVQETRCPELYLTSLADDIKVLGNECDQIYVESTELSKKKQTNTGYRNDSNENVWSCLALQISEIEQVMGQLESFIGHVHRRNRDLAGQPWETKRIEKYRDHLAHVRTSVCNHTVNLHTTLVLLRTVRANTGPLLNSDRYSDNLSELQVKVEKSRPITGVGQGVAGHGREGDLSKCTPGIVANTQSPSSPGSAKHVSDPVYGIPGGIPFHLGSFERPKRVKSLENASRLQYQQTVQAVRTDKLSVTVQNEEYQDLQIDLKRQFAEIDSMADELKIDLVTAAINSGTQSFEAEDWNEAEAFFREAFQTISQLSAQQQACFDVLSMQYKLAACVFHTGEPVAAEKMLNDLVKHQVVSEEQLKVISDAQHLLALSCIRLGHYQRARSECESALLTRRRYFGKDSNAAFESTALLAHIHLLTNNQTRAKSYMAIIPGDRREAVQKGIEKMLEAHWERIKAPPSATSSLFESVSQQGQQKRSVASLQSYTGHEARGDHNHRSHGLVVHTTVPSSPSSNLHNSHLSRQTSRTNGGNSDSVTSISYSTTDAESIFTTTNGLNSRHPHDLKPEARHADDSAYMVSSSVQSSAAAVLSRREILQRVGCHPRDEVEEAVCSGDGKAFEKCLNKKKDFWRSKLRKHVRAERVTALHFAALFGEIDMARRLIASNYNVNEAPFGYSATLTPLTFAIGARQVEMTELLLNNGAKPVEPESWASLAGQLLNKSWLSKTLSEAGRQPLMTQVIAIFKLLLRHGWNINDVIDKQTRRTVLHQAVTFHTGSHRWDMNVRKVTVEFLCEQGANPQQLNREGMTARELATNADHQDLLRIFDGDSRVVSTQGVPWAVELPI